MGGIFTDIYIVFGLKIKTFLYLSDCLTVIQKMKEQISLRGDRTAWIRFVAKVKQQRKEVWDVLGTFIDEYLKEGK